MSNKDPKIGEKKGFHLPHIFIILFGIVLVCAILTWIIPAGNFDRVDVDGLSLIHISWLSCRAKRTRNSSIPFRTRQNPRDVYKRQVCWDSDPDYCRSCWIQFGGS